MGTWVEMWITERWGHGWKCGSLKVGGMGGDGEHGKLGKWVKMGIIDR